MSHINFVTKKEFALENKRVLDLAQETFQYKSNEWMTFQQAKAVGRKPRAGRPGVTITSKKGIMVIFNKEQTGITRR